MTLSDVIAHEKARADWPSNPYFAALRAQTFDRDDFVETQIQFRHAVVFFNRPMTMLAARLPTGALRLDLLDNVMEEHGGGDLARSHGATFTTLLGRLGVSPDAIETRPPWAPVRAFNAALAGVCLADDALTAIATLGMIEDLFAEISAFLRQAIIDNGWLPAEQVVHYAVHEALDVRHAAELYALLDAEHAEAREAIRQGLELGAHTFMSMYRGLHAQRARRDRRDPAPPRALGGGGLLPT